jgi:GT2 family glycosyltransferase
VLLLNPDIELIDLDTQALGTELARRPFGLAAPIIEDGVGGGSLRSHWTRDLLHHALDPLIPRELPPVPRLLPRPRHWWPAGAVLLVDREEFLGLGGFDPRFFLYYEDRDLARRYAGAGLPIRRLECARARHVRGTSSVGELAASPVRQGWSYLSWVEYLAKWERPATATRAVRTARRLGAAVDRGLALLERTGPAAGRAARKRRELADIESFIRDRCDDPVDGGFCPRAREIVTPR